MGEVIMWIIDPTSSEDAEPRWRVISAQLFRGYPKDEVIVVGYSKKIMPIA